MLLFFVQYFTLHTRHVHTHLQKCFFLKTEKNSQSLCLPCHLLWSISCLQYLQNERGIYLLECTSVQTNLDYLKAWIHRGFHFLFVQNDETIVIAWLKLFCLLHSFGKNALLRCELTVFIHWIQLNLSYSGLVYHRFEKSLSTNTLHSLFYFYYLFSEKEKTSSEKETSSEVKKNCDWF